MRKCAFRRTVPAVLLLLLSAASIDRAYCQDYLKELDDIRVSMGEFGKKMPEKIRSSPDSDMRTFERLFEINTYALTTIEAYLKMLKIAIASEGTINQEIVGIFNEWLQFINKYCAADMKYFDEALAEAKDQSLVDIIKEAQANIGNLFKVARKGIEENRDLLK